MKTHIISRLSACAVFALAITGCRAPQPTPSKQTFLIMGTVASISISPDSPADMANVSSLISRTLSELEEKMSAHRSDSDVSMINAKAGQSPVAVSPDTLNLLHLTKYYCEISQGAFDPTVGPLMEAWGLKGAAPTPRQPLDDRVITGLLDLVDWRNLSLSESTAFLEKPNMELDLGGIAKGYSVDVCCHLLLGLGVQNALVDVGGNMRSLGFRDGTRPWIVGVRDPFRAGRLLGAISLSNGEAVASSGNYERFITIAGKRYAHIMDPRTGRPVEGMASVTVVSHSAAEADALSTTLFVLGVDKGLEALRKTSSREAMFVPDRRPVEIIVTPEFSRRFQPEPGMSNRVFIADFTGRIERK